MTARKKQTDDIDIETIADVRVLQNWRNSVDKHLEDIDKKLEKLPDVLIAKLDERYASKDDVEELKETVDPITRFRKKLWAWVVGIIVGEALIMFIIAQWVKEFKV